jgi:hypothetical protein
MVQYIAVAFVGVVAFASLGLTIAAALGVIPWLTLPLTFGELAYPQAGMFVQITLTGLLCAMAFMIPTNARVMKLEHSHRRFQLTMDDVARAYHLCHTADRAGLFTMSSEFDAVRERLAYLRDHPDLAQLEAGVMEVAAQMSQQSRHLADVYSDEKVTQAKNFLAQRQEEAERQQERIIEALHACTEIRKWAEQVDLEESVVASQLQQLDEKLQAALPSLGYTLEHEDEEEQVQNVVAMSKKPAAE